MCESKEILLETRDAVGIITINRPDSLNSLSDGAMAQFSETLSKMACIPEVKVVIITGAGGRSFSAGSDIKEMTGLGPLEMRYHCILGHQLFTKIEQFPKPVIAAIDGYALGGGTELALSCDFRIATERSKFGVPEINLSVFPASGGTQRLARAVGQLKAKELIFLGEMIDAKEALALGLINKVVPVEDLMPAVLDLASKLSSKNSLALEISKALINKSYEVDMHTGTLLETLAIVPCVVQGEMSQKIAAVVGKK